MAFPIDDLTTNSLDQTTDSPDMARVELLSAVTKIKAIIAATGVGANNSLKLDATGSIPASVSVLGVATTGVWLPTIFENSIGQSQGQVYAVQFGTWTKIAKMVHVMGQVSLSSIGTMNTSNALFFGGFPFNGRATGPYGTIIFTGLHGLLSPNTGLLTGRIIGNNNYCNMTLDAAITAKILTIGDVVLNKTFQFDGWYPTN